MSRASRRNALQIVREILETEDASRTEIRWAVGLNSKQIGRYLGHLVACGVLQEEVDVRTGRRRYITTSKGSRLVQLLDELAQTPGLRALFDPPP